MSFRLLQPASLLVVPFAFAVLFLCSATAFGFQLEEVQYFGNKQIKQLIADGKLDRGKIEARRSEDKTTLARF